MITFNEFMQEQRVVDKWFVVKIALYGAFCGALLATGFFVTSMGIWF